MQQEGTTNTAAPCSPNCSVAISLSVESSWDKILSACAGDAHCLDAAGALSLSLSLALYLVLSRHLSLSLALSLARSLSRALSLPVSCCLSACAVDAHCSDAADALSLSLSLSLSLCVLSSVGVCWRCALFVLL